MKPEKRFVIVLSILVLFYISMFFATDTKADASHDRDGMITCEIPLVTLDGQTVLQEMSIQAQLSNLYALSAVLMDGESGRILFEKDGESGRANASTTKVLTCILALENGSGDDYVTVSKRAAAQPDVQLGIQAGEQYYLEDLLYSMMLQSHNDSAVAVAEYIGGSVEQFASMMNARAKEMGCTNTHFVTPNGLDETDEGGMHHTTAHDLALIMKCAIANPTFLRITQTREYSFTDLKKKRSFTVHNANRLFDLTDGAISGKTGYTSNAGYCYVCACKESDKTFIVVLLGCGWPNHKNYKWTDTKTLLTYGKTAFHYAPVYTPVKLSGLPVKDGVPQKNTSTNRTQEVPLSCEVTGEEEKMRVLLADGETIEKKLSLPHEITAPVSKGQCVGHVTYTLNGDPLLTLPVITVESVKKITYSWCLSALSDRYF